MTAHRSEILRTWILSAVLTALVSAGVNIWQGL